MSPTGTLTLAAAYRFFVPLIFMTELNMISKSVINAALARSPDQNVTLAAFHIAFTLYFALTSSTEVCGLLTLAYLKTRQALAPLARFMVLMVAVPWLIAQAIAFTPLGDAVFGGLFGASPAVVAQAREAIFLLSLSAPILIVRAIAFGLILLNERTIFITFATFVRLVSLGLSLLVLPHVMQGAAVGAAALVICMLLETLIAVLFAARFFRRLPARAGPGVEAPPGLRAQWRFSWPLMLNSSAEMGVVLVLSVFLGLLADADLALAAFNVVYGLVSLLMSPMRNLVQTAQTLVRTAADRQVLQRFTWHLIGFFALLAALLFLTPLSDPILAGAMGLQRELQAVCAPAMQFAFLMSAAWAFSALARGLLAGARDTAMMAASGISRVLLAVVIGAGGVFTGVENGAVIGLAGWIAGYAGEALLLARQLRTRTATPNS